MAVMDALAKWLILAGNHPVQLLAVRSWMTLAFFTYLLFYQSGTSIRTPHWGLHLIRGLIGACAPILFFLALKELPLAETTAVFFSASFIMTALSAWFLKEYVGAHRWLAVLVGFCGVLLITRPGAEAFRIEALFVFGASLAYSILVVSGRWLSRTDSVFSLVFYFNLAIAVVCTVPLPWIWQPMTMQTLFGVVVFAALALLGHFGIAQAFKVAPVGVVAPFEYMALIWATLLGFIIWGDLPAQISFLGMFIIISSGLYILHRERLAKKTNPLN